MMRNDREAAVSRALQSLVQEPPERLQFFDDLHRRVRRQRSLRAMVALSCAILTAGALIAGSTLLMQRQSVPNAGVLNRQAAIASPSLLIFGGPDVSFHYPSAWHSYQFKVTSSFTRLITYLSTTSLRDPCVSTTLPSGDLRTSCGLPLARLGPGGVLVTWSSWGKPYLRLSQQPGYLTRLGERPARVTSGPAGGACAELGGTYTVRASIQSRVMDLHDQLIVVDACLQDARTLPAVNRMLASTHLP